MSAKRKWALQIKINNHKWKTSTFVYNIQFVALVVAEVGPMKPPSPKWTQPKFYSTHLYM
jgi:hypothetical protein